MFFFYLGPDLVPVSVLHGVLEKKPGKEARHPPTHTLSVVVVVAVVPSFHLPWQAIKNRIFADKEAKNRDFKLHLKV